MKPFRITINELNRLKDIVIAGSLPTTLLDLRLQQQKLAIITFDGNDDQITEATDWPKTNLLDQNNNVISQEALNLGSRRFPVESFYNLTIKQLLIFALTQIDDGYHIIEVDILVRLNIKITNLEANSQTGTALYAKLIQIRDFLQSKFDDFETTKTIIQDNLPLVPEDWKQ